MVHVGQTITSFNTVFIVFNDFEILKDESTEKVYDINLDYIMSSARESDGSGTVATERQFQVTASGGGDPSSTGSNEKGESVQTYRIMR